MKSLRYLFVVAWLITMTSLGMFSNIDSLGGVFDSAQRQGDAYGHPQPLENFTYTPPADSKTVQEEPAPQPAATVRSCTSKKPACRKRKPCLKKKKVKTPGEQTKADSMNNQAVVTVSASGAMRSQG